MKAFSSVALCLSLLTITACEEEYIEDPRLFPVENSADASNLHAQLCQSHAKALFLEEGSVIRWQAIKDGVTTVEGTQRLSGHLASDSTTHMQGLVLHLDFDVASIDSADELRDTRVMNYIFGLAEGLPMSFDLASASAEGQVFPTDATGSATDFTGTLAVTNKEVALTLKASMTKSTEGFVLSTGTTPVTLNLRTDLGLTAEVDRLMALVPGVTLDDTITISFDLLFKDDCA